MEFGYEDDELNQQDNLYYEEHKGYETVDLKEAIGAIGQDGSILKLLGVFIWAVPVILLMFASYLYAKINLFENPGQLAGFLLLSTVVSFAYWILTGYYSLYAHDRALDKNAKLRDWSTCVPDALMVGIKKAFGMWLLSLSMGGIVFLCAIVSAVLGMLIPVIGVIFIAIIAILCLYLWLLLYFKIYPFFLIDFRISAWVQWKKAWQLSKDVHYGKLNIILAVLFDIAVAIPFIIATFIAAGFIGGASAFINPTHLVSDFTMFVIFVVMLILYFTAGFIITVFWKNIFGQFTYNAIKQNRRISPEKLSKIINKDKLPIVIAAIVLMLLNLLSTLSNFSRTSQMQKLTDRQATLKMKMAISQYENMAQIYMAENGTTSVQNMYGSNCVNAPMYFKIAEQYKPCNFTTADGNFWQLNPQTGGAIISDSPSKPKISLKVGVCYGGQVNCEYEYPEAYKFMNEGKSNNGDSYGKYGFLNLNKK